MKLYRSSMALSLLLFTALIIPFHAVLAVDGDGAAPVQDVQAGLQELAAGRNPGGFTVAGPSAEVVVNGDTGTTAGLSFQEAGTTAWRFLSDPSTTHLALGTPTFPNLFVHKPDGELDLYYQGSGNALRVSGSSSFAIVYAKNEFTGAGWGISGGMYSDLATSNSYGVFGFNYGTGYGVYGVGYNTGGGTGVRGIFYSNGNYGELGTNSYGVKGYHNGGNYGVIGDASYGVIGTMVSADLGDYGVFGAGPDSSTEVGTGYGRLQTLGGVVGYNIWGNPYTFAVSGYSYLDNNRSGGVFGSTPGGTSQWGSLAYKDSAGLMYGGYFTSYTVGSGRNGAGEVELGIGMGAHGNLLGAYVRGESYGLYVQGERYGQYTRGDAYIEGCQVMLQEAEDGRGVAAYATTSAAPEVYASGIGRLSGGKAAIRFSPEFAALISPEEPVIVTATPIGRGAQLYIEEWDAEGFVVADDADASSDVQFTWIAVGKRKGFEKHQVPAELLDPRFGERMDAVTLSDHDTTRDALGMYMEDGELRFGEPPVAPPVKEISERDS
jgi:hypothetical protein